MTSRLSWRAPAALGGALILALASLVGANGLQAQLHLGRMWTNPENDGAESDAAEFPGGIPRAGQFGDGSSQAIKRGWVGFSKKHATYMFSLNWTDPEGTTWEYAASYFFRSMNYNYPPVYTSNDPSGNMNYLYPVRIQEYLRWPRPRLLIATHTAELDTSFEFSFFPGSEGLDDFVYPASGGRGPRPDPIIDPNLVTEEKIETVWRYIMGVEYHRDVYEWPFGTPHQDYTLWDIKMVNNGISGRTAEDHPPADAPVLENQTITKMIWAQGIDYRTQAIGGSQHGKDTDAMYVEPWGEGNHSAVLFWDIDDQTEGGNPGPDWGDPAEDPYYEGHLLGNGYLLFGPIFCSAGPGAEYNTDDPAQPAFRTIWYERGFDIAGKDYSPADPQQQREFLAGGLLQMPLNASYRDQPATAAIAEDNAGPTAIWGFGKLGGEVGAVASTEHGWDLGWMDSLHIVQVLAVGGINREEGRRIGIAWNTAKDGGADPSTWMSADDIALVQTGHDTAMKAAAMAWWNYYGSFPPNVLPTDLAKWGVSDMVASKPAEYNQPFNTPDPPRPPGLLSIRPDPNQGIEVRWTREAESEPDHDTGVMDFAGYRVYRQTGSRLAPWELIVDWPAERFVQVDAEGDLPAGLVYIDKDVVPGTDYWYAVVAYDDGSQNWARPGKSLESTRWWTWSGYSHIGVTAPEPTAVSVDRPNRFALDQNVPNPFNPTTTIRFSLPDAGHAELVIYNPAGQVVRTLVSGTLEGGVHEVVWDGTDAFGRPVASGVYVYRLTSGERTLMRRMVLVR